MPASNGIIPVPDPSTLTTEQSKERAKAERDYVNGKMEVLEAKLGTLVQRMDDRDEATKVLHETVTRVPTEMQLAIGHLHDLMNEKFASSNTRFDINDDRWRAESIANETKVNAAFAAQKEAAAKQDEANSKAIDKSERASSETINKNAAADSAGRGALSDKIDDVKDRLVRLEDRTTKIEATKVGGQESTAESRAASAQIRNVIAFGMSLILAAIIIIGVIIAAKTGTPAP